MPLAVASVVKQSHAMSENFPNLPAAIAAYADKPGQSQASLARALGLSRGTITRWVQGEEPEVKRLRDLAKELGVTIGYLADDSDWVRDEGERRWLEVYRNQTPEVLAMIQDMTVAVTKAIGGPPK